MDRVQGSNTSPLILIGYRDKRDKLPLPDSTDDPDADSEDLSTQIIRENPKFGAECFLKLLGQKQGDRSTNLRLDVGRFIRQLRGEVGKRTTWSTTTNSSDGNRVTQDGPIQA